MKLPIGEKIYHYLQRHGVDMTKFRCVKLIKTKHKCTIAEFYYRNSIASIAINCIDIDPLGGFIGFFNYCPYCGKRITKKMKEEFWHEEVNNDQ